MRLCQNLLPTSTMGRLRLMGAVLHNLEFEANGRAALAALTLELLGFARKRLGAAIAPRELSLVHTLPRTRSGKILRRLLRARELGLPEGDISTLESDS